MAALDGGANFIGVGGSDEGLWIIVGLGKETVDGGLKLGDGFAPWPASCYYSGRISTVRG
jgi:hypothetical protein